jgi:hypothetical protein
MSLREIKMKMTHHSQRAKTRMDTTQSMISCLLATAALFSQPASALTSVTGQVGWVTIVGYAGGAPGNYDLRISLTTSGVICTSYVNANESNYQAVVAAVLAAKSLGSTVRLDVTPDGGTGYCHLTSVVME